MLRLMILLIVTLINIGCTSITQPYLPTPPTSLLESTPRLVAISYSESTTMVQFMNVVVYNNSLSEQYYEDLMLWKNWYNQVYFKYLENNYGNQ